MIRLVKFPSIIALIPSLDSTFGAGPAQWDNHANAENGGALGSPDS
jgi:hypothetical protein